MISNQTIDAPMNLHTAKRRYNVMNSASLNIASTLPEIDMTTDNVIFEPINGSLLDIFADNTLGFMNADTNVVSSESEESSVDSEPPRKRRKSSKKPTNKFRPYQAEKWQERFDELIKFQKDNDHCLVPHTYPENPALARWVKRQRYQHKLLEEGKQSSITPDRIKILEEIGFVWDSHEAAWQERLKELHDYKINNGNCLVPSNYPENPQLATWVKCQRRQYKLYWEGRPSNMTVERIMTLEKASFSWELRSSSHSKKAAEQEAKALSSMLPLECDADYGLLMDLLTDIPDDDFDDAILIDL